MLCTKGVFFLTSSRYFPSIFISSLSAQVLPGSCGFHILLQNKTDILPQYVRSAIKYLRIPTLALSKSGYRVGTDQSALSACSGKLPFCFIMLPGQSIVNILSSFAGRESRSLIRSPRPFCRPARRPRSQSDPPHISADLLPFSSTHRNAGDSRLL